MKYYYLILILFFSFNIASQNINIDKDLKIKQVNIIFNPDYDNPNRIHCSDIIKNDSITIYLGKSGLGGYSLRLRQYKGKITPKIIRWTDYPAFDGKSSVELEIKRYNITMSSPTFKPGDTLNVSFKIKLKKGKFSDGRIIEGSFLHLIGNNKFVWDDNVPRNESDFYRKQFKLESINYTDD